MILADFPGKYYSLSDILESFTKHGVAMAVFGPATRRRQQKS